MLDEKIADSKRNPISQNVSTGKSVLDLHSHDESYHRCRSPDCVGKGSNQIFPSQPLVAYQGSLLSIQDCLLTQIRQEGIHEMLLHFLLMEICFSNHNTEYFQKMWKKFPKLRVFAMKPLCRLSPLVWVPVLRAGSRLHLVASRSICAE